MSPMINVPNKLYKYVACRKFKNFKKDIDRVFSIKHHALPSDNLYIDNTHNIYTEIVFLM